MKRKVLIIGVVVVFTIAFIVSCFLCIKVTKIEPEVYNDEPAATSLNDDALLQVLKGEREFITKDGESLINNLKIEDINVKINSYAFIDLDGDSKKEIIAVTDSYYDYYYVLHIENNIIYGCEVSKNDFRYLNTKGIVYVKKDNDIYYRRFKFSKNKYKYVDVASRVENIYHIGKEEVSSEDFKSYENDFVVNPMITYRALNFSWMEKTLTNKYSFEKDKSFRVNTTDLDFIFMNDTKYDNFNNDLLNEKYHLYYIDSNGNRGKVSVHKKDTELLKDNNELNANKVVGVYDENTQYIIIIRNVDRMDTDYDNYSIAYYFKFYNKNVQLEGSKRITNISEILSEETIKSLEEKE